MIELSLPRRFAELAAVVTRIDDDDLRLLAEAERERAATIASPRRREEWIASRIAARLLLERAGLTDDPAAATIHSASRPPRITTASGKDVFVSLSHSAGVGAAAVGALRVGVDLERERAVDWKLAKFFLRPAETDAARRLEVDNVLLHLWSAKEAAFKLAATATLLNDIELVDISRVSGGIRARFVSVDVSATVETFRHEAGFVLGLATE